MSEDLINHPTYLNTIQRLEAIKRRTAQDIDYWMARDINTLLGYSIWRSFEAVIERAKSALEANGIDSSHHIVQTDKMMGVGGGANVKGIDYFLTRAACRLVAMNGDPSKPEIAGAQAYFVVQTQRMEQNDANLDDMKRLELRQRVTVAFRQVSGVAKDAGVPNQKQALFHDARYQGLYGMSKRQVMVKKGLKAADNPFDHVGPLELSANEFQMNMAADVIKNEKIRGEANAIAKNKKIAQDVRNTMKTTGATMPEDLLAAEPIRIVEKRVKQQKRLSE